MKNKAIYMHGTNKMVWKDIEIPSIGESDVLIKVKCVGVCGSDLHYFSQGNIGDFVVTGDFILGHEAAGVVEKIGDEVKHLKVGDIVAMEPGVPCSQCEFCLSGKYNLCPDVEFFATPPYHGVFAEYVKHPAKMCFKLPDNMTTTEGAMIEPLSVGLHATQTGEVSLGQTVVIYGTGCIGLATLLSAKARGASKVVVIDIVDTRLKHAKKLGADYTLNAKTEDVFSMVMSLTNQMGADVVIDTSGAEMAIKQSVNLLKPAGIIVLVGMTSNAETSFDFMKLMSKEGQIRPIFRYRNLYPTAINAVSSGQISVADIVSHYYKFNDTEQALNDALNQPESVIKAVIQME